MENILKRYNTTKMNEDQIDKVSFYEGILACAPQIEAACKEIDKQVNRIANARYEKKYNSPYHYHFDIDTKEQFDAVIELTDIKIELVKIYEFYTKWYKALDDKRKQFVETYFIKKNADVLRKISKDGQYYSKHIIPVIASFRYYLKLMYDFNELDLFSNPIIYESYVKTYDRNIRRKNKKEKK